MGETSMFRSFWLRATAGSLVGLAVTGGASASDDAVAQFYRGKQVTMLIGSSPGGGYDLYARLIARHLGKYIPGNPTIVPSNMPGAGSHTAAGHRSEEHTSELQSRQYLVCRLLLEKK